ncbi:MAG: formyltransferase family protein [Candidatus Rokubacteria bacterium]|nr:formyltransferase family protein [Candidatus Rokubacteria bacterium]
MSGARWVVFAYHTFGARALQGLLARGENIAAVVTHADDPAEGDWFESVANVARSAGIPVLAPPSPGLAEVAATLGPLEADLFLSVWYRRLLGPDLLRLPRIAALNLHGSLLPAYRGRAPVNWVLANGERRTGVTLHHMIAEADAGDIVAQVPIEIGPEDTALTLYQRVVKEGVDLLLEWYPAVLAGTAPRIPQDPARATLWPRRGPEDGRVEWGWPAERIANMIRAVTHPYPGAFVGNGPGRLFLWSGAAAPEVVARAVPGTLLALRPGEGIVVATGRGSLVLRRLQEAGRPEEPADGWARRRGLGPGDWLEGRA